MVGQIATTQPTMAHLIARPITHNLYIWYRLVSFAIRSLQDQGHVCLVLLPFADDISWPARDHILGSFNEPPDAD